MCSSDLYFYAGGLDVNLTPSGFGMGRLRDGWMHAGKFVGGVCGGICVETETLADGDHATLTHPDSTPDWTSDEIFRHIQKVSDMGRQRADVRDSRACPPERGLPEEPVRLAVLPPVRGPHRAIGLELEIDRRQRSGAVCDQHSHVCFHMLS